MLLAGSVAAALPLAAKTKKPKPQPPKDGIEVLSMIPASGGQVTRFLSTTHYSSRYLYVEHATKDITLIDVTNPKKPAVLAEKVSLSGGDASSLFAVVGTAALMINPTPAAASVPASNRTVRIMDFSDPAHPAMVREFAGVTALEREQQLIFIANAEGIFILQQHLAEDPQVQEDYAHHVLYE